MFVSQVCERDVVAVMREASVLEAARLMRERHVGNVVVLEIVDGRAVPAGILTDRDIVVSGVAVAPERLSTLRVEDLMTPHPVKVWENDTLDTAIEAMNRNGVRRLPVVDHEGELVGVISFQDVVTRLTRKLSRVVEHSTTQHRAEVERF
jgi:CBS domain-containing protein